MSKEAKFGRPQYNEVLNKDLGRITKKMGRSHGEIGQIYSIPADKTFTMGANQSQGNCYVSKIVFGESGPNIVPKPHRIFSKPIKSEYGESKTQVIYHVFEGSSSIWRIPFIDNDGKLSYFHAGDKQVLEYLSNYQNKEKARKVKGKSVNKNKDEAEKTPSLNSSIEESLKSLVENNTVVDSLQSAARSLFVRSNISVKNMRHEIAEVNGLTNVSFGTDKGMLFGNEQKLVYTLPNGDKEIQCGWHTLTKNGVRAKVTPEAASMLLSKIV